MSLVANRITVSRAFELILVALATGGRVSGNAVGLFSFVNRKATIYDVVVEGRNGSEKIAMLLDKSDPLMTEEPRKALKTLLAPSPTRIIWLNETVTWSDLKDLARRVARLRRDVSL